jgi:small subunit ribosomal protein S6
MHKYELVIVLDGKATSAKKKTVTEKLEKLINSVKGTIGKAKDLGTKDLAYKIDKSLTGAYLLLPLELDGPGAKEISNKLRLENDLIRYLLVRSEK